MAPPKKEPNGKGAVKAKVTSAKKGQNGNARTGCIPPNILSARRIEASIKYAETGYYLFFLVTIPMLLWRYGSTLRYDLGFGSGDPVCDTLTQWIVDNGGTIDGARCINSPEGGGRGVIATSKIGYRQTYVVIPVEACFWEQPIQQRSKIAHILRDDDVIGDFAGRPWGNSTEPWRLILAWAYESQQPDSFWKPFFDSCPEVPTSPVWWSDADFDELQSLRVIKEVLGIQEEVMKAYDTLFPYLSRKYPEYFPRNKFTLKTLTTAALHVWGRAFDADARDPNTPGRRTWQMVPFIDLINHQSYLDSSYGDETDNNEIEFDGAHFSCWATECFTSGSEIFHSYGSHKSSSHFFLYYGFIPTGSEFGDFVTFLLPNVVTETFPKKTWEVGYAGADGHINEAWLHNVVRAHIISKRGGNESALSTAEVLADEDAWRTVLQYLLDKVNQHIDSKPTTLEYDEAELAKPWSGYDRWLKMTVRVRFKLVLHRVRENLEYRVNADVNVEQWAYDQQLWTIVYQEDTVNVDNSIAFARETLYEIPCDLAGVVSYESPDEEELFPYSM